ncbi:DNA damage checkpoint control protein, partial [Kappamyces sp. JEL0680]
YEQPRMPMADITIKLPPLEKLRKLTDRLKPLGSGEMTVGANLAGQLELSVQTDTICVKTEFHDQDDVLDEDLPVLVSQRRDTQFNEMLVGIADFGLTLSMAAMRPTAVECSIYRNIGLM